MPKYLYQAIDQLNTKQHGVLEADTADAARLNLVSTGFTVVSLREQHHSNWNVNVSLRISKKEITFFTKNFSVMLGAGLTVVESLIIAEGQATGRLRSILHSILSYVESGHSLADAFAQHRRYFSSIYVDVIRTGELSGTLARNLQQLADRLAGDLDLRRKVIGALTYPIIVLVAVIGLAILLSVFVLPRLTRLFLSLDIPLPTATRILLDASAWFAQWWWAVITIGVVATIVLRLIFKIPALEYIWHSILLRLPVVGGMVRNVNLSRITGTLGALLRSGVPITEALQAVVHTANSQVYRRALRNSLLAVEQGGTLASYLEKHGRIFPPIVSRMVAVGERTGQMDGMLLYLGQYYDGEVDASTKQLGVVIEPILLIFIGMVVLFVGISVITPIYQFTASVGRL